MKELTIALILLLAGAYLKFSYDHPDRFRTLETAVMVAAAALYLPAIGWNMATKFAFRQTMSFLAPDDVNKAWRAVDAWRFDEVTLSWLGWMCILFLIAVGILHRLRN